MSAGDRNPFETDLDKNPANYMPMHPSRFLERSAEAFPGRTAMIHGARRFTYAEQHERSVRLASALAKRGIGSGDTVALMGANTPETLEAHFGVPMTGAVLNPLNTRLDAAIIAFILDHGGAKVLLTDTEFAPDRRGRPRHRRSETAGDRHRRQRRSRRQAAGRPRL